MNVGRLIQQSSHKEVACVRPSTTLRETAQKLAELNIGALVVTHENGSIVGIVSERDFVPVIAKSHSDQADRPVSDIMTTDVFTCRADDEISVIFRIMNQQGFRHMPVVAHGRLTGMVSIRELNRAYEILRLEANTDPLTSVSNRRPFVKKLEEEFDRAKRFDDPISVAMLDVDHFKAVNDRYGHDAGDEVLRALAGLFISEFRSIDLVGRLGGEEFALIFPQTHLSGAEIACQRLLQSIRNTAFDTGSYKLSLTVSIGIAAGPADFADGAALLKRADELLYRAKNGGRDQLQVAA